MKVGERIEQLETPVAVVDLDKLEAELNRQNATIEELEEAYKTALNVINLQHKQISKYAIKFEEEVEPSGLREKLTGQGGDEA